MIVDDAAEIYRRDTVQSLGRDGFVQRFDWLLRRYLPQASPTTAQVSLCRVGRLNCQDRLSLAPSPGLPNLRAAVAMRNALIHGYRKIEPEIVWLTATRRLPGLRAQVAALLDELGNTWRTH